MAPGGSGKRKRGDRTWSADGTEKQRPSPHRPESLSLAQQSQAEYNQSHGRDQENQRGRGGRRSSRGGRGAPPLRSPTGPPRQGVNQAKSPTATLPTTSPSIQNRREQRDAIQPNSQPISMPAPPSSRDQTSTKPNAKKPYYYGHLSDTRIENWSSTGRQEVVERGKQAVSEEDYMTISALYQEIVRAGLDHRIAPQDAGNTIKDIIGDSAPVETSKNSDEPILKQSPFDARIVFLDTISILTDSDHDDPDLRPIILSTEIPAAMMRQILETPLLQSLGLIRDTFARMGIRKQTNLLYRQSNYNLLREESEGYSKLMTELFTTSSTISPTTQAVADTFEKVKAMIGAFDMDVGRVLDVVLDVFASVMIRQGRFFVKLLRMSSWWPKEDHINNIMPQQFPGGLPKWALPDHVFGDLSEEEKVANEQLSEERDRMFWKRIQQVGLKAFFEIGRRPASDLEMREAMADPNGADVTDGYGDMRWIKETGTLPPPGSRVAAQLLGFKLRFYSSSSRSSRDELPENLIYLTALLIKIGFISLRDVYPHLWPVDGDMEDVRQKKMAEKEKAEREKRPGGGTNNALAMAAALTDDSMPAAPPGRIREADAKTATPARTEAPEKGAPEKTQEEEALPETRDQKVFLLEQLLLIGALPDALFILGKFPWLLDVYPDLSRCLMRILHYSLSGVHWMIEPPQIFGANEQAPAPDADQSGLPKGHIRLSDYPPRKTLRRAALEVQDDVTEHVNYKFYWDEWADNIPRCRSVDDVFSLCRSLLTLLGVKIGLDSPLLTKLARIGKYSLREDSSESNRARWLDLCKRVLVPALTLTSQEPGVVNEVWDILSQYPRHIRYEVYATWYQGTVAKESSDIKGAFEYTKALTKDALKRISKTNIKHMARVLAKIAYSSPGTLFENAINQMESYDNLIPVVVHCARYFSELGYDVMTWVLLSNLGKERNRFKEDGQTRSKWLISLAAFTGRVFKQYERTDCLPVIQYVAEQLRQGNSTDLILLEQLTSSMGGIVTDASFNDAQIQAMGGGKLLQSQTMLQLLDKRNESKSGSKRLMKALNEDNLAGQLLILIAQERKTCVYNAKDQTHLKLLGNIFDEVHRALTQYLDFIRHNLCVEDFNKCVPDTASLINEFGVEPEVAFWINRESVAYAMAEADRLAQERNERRKSETLATAGAKGANEDVEMAKSHVETTKPATPNGETKMEIDSKAAESSEKGEDATSVQTVTENVSPATPKEANGDSMSPWHPVLQDQLEKLQTSLPEDLAASLRNIGLPFYVTFWQLSLFDLHIPAKAYEDEMERLKKRVIAIGNDRSDLSVTGTRKKELAKKETVKLQDQLLSENKSHLKSYSQTRMRLQKEKEHWFVGLPVKPDGLCVTLLEQCFLPRIFLSPVDSFYCFKMFKFLHSSGTPNFRTMMFLDQLFREQRLVCLMFMCTSNEAENLGRFMSDVLRDLSRWHGDKALYEREAYGPKKDLPGFARSIDPDRKATNFLDYEDFRRLLFKWHRFFNGALKTCLMSDEYMHIRNAILVLKAVHQVFPVINFMGSTQLQCVNRVIEREKERQDLKIAATSLLGNLKRREKQWALPQAFHITESSTSGVNGVRSAASTPAPPRAQPPSQKPFNAAAAESKPTSRTNVENKGKLEVEDGEIEDAKMTDAPGSSAEGTGSAGQDKSSSTEKPENKDAAEQRTEPRQVSAPLTASPKPANASPRTRPDITSTREEPGLKDTEQRASTRPTPKDSKPNGESSTRLENPMKPEFDRSGTGIRTQHLLPNRPDARSFRQPETRIPPRPPVSAADERREPRDMRHQEYARPSRLGDQDRDRLPPREESHGPRDHARPQERGILDREREYHDPQRLDDRVNASRAPDDRGNRAPPRDIRGSARETEWQERSTRSRPQESYSARNERESTAREAPIDSSHSMGPHPERAALIQQSEREIRINSDRDHRSEGPKSETEDRRNRLSRPPSPRRQDDRLSRDDRHDERRQAGEGRVPSDSMPPKSSSHSQSNDRPFGRDRDHSHRPPPPFDQTRGNESQREPRSGLLPPPKFESTHGRLNQDDRPHRHDPASQEKSNPSQEIPLGLGPRGGRLGPGRGGRGGGLVQPRINTQAAVQQNPPSSHERQPPTGPSSGRAHLRNSSHHEPSASAPPSTPSTPTVQPSETAGIHPDRLKAIQSPSEDSRQGQSQRSQRPNPVHAPSPTSVVPPSGPRSNQISPTGPQAPAARGPPSGPSFTGSEPSRGDKRFAGLQQTLAGGQDRGGMGAAIRGRGSRPGGSNQSPQSSAPPTPGPDPYPPAPNGRPDLFAGRSEEGSHSRHPLHQSQQHSEDDPRNSRDRRRPETESSSDPRRSTRHSSNRVHGDERDRDRDRIISHDMESRVSASGRRDTHRDNRDYDHSRDRRPETGMGSREMERHDARDGRDLRESSSRRPREDGHIDNPPAKRPRRSERDRDDFNGPYDRRQSGPLAPPPHHPPAMPQQTVEERRWGGRDHRDNRDRIAHRDERDRDRDRDRDRRDGGSGGYGNGSLRKRGRPPGLGDGEGERDSGMGSGSGSGRGGPSMRPDNKRPRRGPP